MRQNNFIVFLFDYSFRLIIDNINLNCYPTKKHSTYLNLFTWLRL